MPESRHTLTTTIAKSVQLPYLLYTPANYDADPDATFPLILFLHGSGERGSDLDLVRNIGLAKKLQTWADCPFVVVSPQCPADSIWALQLDALDALLNHVIQHYRIDTHRVYVTGLSLGGTGTWYMTMAYPTRFAAVAPICGRGTSLSAVENLAQTPIWCFHGAQDDVVPLSESQRMVEGLKKVGADVRLTIYPDANHDSWTAAYAEPDLYTWLLQHRR
ncbi:MAG: prolyl oligopeptidase family serine peptidase [Anaerolineae bacterium]|nr:prolyl oligopeptidase family serine peptidase [Anaerolineae bacterium]